MGNAMERQLLTTPLQTDYSCVLFAMHREATPFCRALRSMKKMPNAPCWARLHSSDESPVLVTATGIGRANTERTLAWILGNSIPRPRVVVAAGFCGALSEDLRTGDLLLATKVIECAT